MPLGRSSPRKEILAARNQHNTGCEPPENEQLVIGFPEPEDEIRRVVQQLAGIPLQIILTDNASSMLSYRKAAPHTVVRMHRMFLAADATVLAEIAAFIRNRRAVTPNMRAFIRANGHLVKAPQRRSLVLITRGRVHDLAELFAELNAMYFSGGIASAITWSSRAPQFGVRKRNLGCYDRRKDLIRISRYLDRSAVPRYYVAYVVYHEMLHAAIGVQQKNGRCLVHTAEFKKREKLFHDYGRAIAWEQGRR
jgi:hypothetical protein